jgi:hypothetical protein
MAADSPLWLEIAGAVAIPLAIAALPVIAARRRRRGFLRLLDRELAELNPEPDAVSGVDRPGEAWKRALQKRFVHEAFVSDPSVHHEFLLSLPPGLVYDLTQMWNHFHKAEAADSWGDLATHGQRFCDYLESILASRRASLATAEAWQELVRQVEARERESNAKLAAPGP